MGRLRSIKPAFFVNEELAEIEPLGRLLFIGLWTIADRDGRLEDRPRRIHVELLPYDEADVDKLLGELHDRGFITRYVVGDQRIIQVTSWRKHQYPHAKESDSVLPAQGAKPVQTPTKTPVAHKASPVLAEDADFEAFWAAYPRKLDKSRARGAWAARMKEKVAPTRIISAARNYSAWAAGRPAEDQKFLKHPATFVGPHRPYEEWEQGAPECLAADESADLSTGALGALAASLAEAGL